MTIGWDQASLEAANEDTRRSLISDTEQLFRIPEGAGKVTIAYYEGELAIHNTLPHTKLSDFGQKLFDQIMNFRKLNGSSEGSASYSSPERTIRSEESAWQDETMKSSVSSNTTSVANTPSIIANQIVTQTDDEDVIIWTDRHDSVGTKVANYFDDATTGKRKLFAGWINRYAPPSKRTAKDQLYHVVYEDGDEADLDETEFRHSKLLYREKVQHKERSVTKDAIGQVVAKPVVSNASDSAVKKRKHSEISMSDSVRYGKIVNVEVVGKSKIMLYRVSWDDNTESVLTDSQVNEGIRYNREHPVTLDPL